MKGTHYTVFKVCTLRSGLGNTWISSFIIFEWCCTTMTIVTMRTCALTFFHIFEIIRKKIKNSFSLRPFFKCLACVHVMTNFSGVYLRGRFFHIIPHYYYIDYTGFRHFFYLLFAELWPLGCFSKGECSSKCGHLNCSCILLYITKISGFPSFSFTTNWTKAPMSLFLCVCVCVCVCVCSSVCVCVCARFHTYI